MTSKLADVTVLLDLLTSAELRKLRDSIDLKIRSAQEEDLATAREMILDIARKAGMTPLELVEMAKGTRKTTKPAVVKYKNPKTDETWTGRGRKPSWLVAHLETGGTLEAVAA